MTYAPLSTRYDSMQYRRSGRSGLLLPAISLGLWHNFGGVDRLDNGRAMLRRAFDLGITHFDLANNYGPPPGSAEENFGRILHADFASYRDELVISTKAGWDMWPGPYGDWGSPVEETMSALEQAVRSGKALYVGISSYDRAETRAAVAALRHLGIRCLIHQPQYSMFEREIESGLLDVLGEEGVGCIAFCPLAQGLLTDRYLAGIPADSRANKPHGFLKREDVSESRLGQVRALDALARSRGQSVAQLALAWVLRDPRVTSALVGASRVDQVEENVRALANLRFSSEELARIEAILERDPSPSR